MKSKKTISLVKKAHEYHTMKTINPRTIEEYHLVFNKARGGEIRKEYAKLILHRLKSLGLVQKVKREHLVNQPLLDAALLLNPTQVGVFGNAIYRNVYDACGDGSSIETIMKTTDYGENRVRRALYLLQKHGLVARDEVYYQLPFDFSLIEKVEEIAKELRKNNRLNLLTIS